MSDHILVGAEKDFGRCQIIFWSEPPQQRSERGQGEQGEGGGRVGCLFGCPRSPVGALGPRLDPDGHMARSGGQAPSRRADEGPVLGPRRPVENIRPAASHAVAFRRSAPPYTSLRGLDQVEFDRSLNLEPRPPGART